MEAGRKLDVLIAEKVMGTLTATVPGTPYVFGRCPEMDAVIPPYSTSIAAAWEVVEKLRQGAEDGDASVFVQVDNGKAWFGANIDFQGKNTLLFAESRGAESAPHAICLAALKAVGVG